MLKARNADARVRFGEKAPAHGLKSSACSVSLPHA